MNKISLDKFLKLYTAIPNSFIDEYIKFYYKCENNKYGIQLDDVIKYLSVKLHKKFKDRIRNSFIENKDYIIKKQNGKKLKNVVHALYYITFETFEKLCLSSTTEKGKQYRDYYIMMRKFIDYYKEDISNTILSKLNNKSNKNFIYIIKTANSNIFKIGKTNNIRNRLKAYLTGKLNHPDIEYIIKVDNNDIVEKCVKNILEESKYRNNFELYNLELEKLKLVINDCAELQHKYNDKNTSKNINTYVIFDNNKTIKTINLNNDVRKIKSKTLKLKNKITKQTKKNIKK